MADKFSRATGKSLEEWMRLIPAELSHKEMAQAAVEAGATPWWAQGIAVEIERRIGRRKVGESCTGDINASTSKTVPGVWTEVFDALAEFLATKCPFDIEEPTTSATEKWRYWRADVTDGTKITINVSDGGGKSKIGVQHSKLPDHDARQNVKDVWQSTLTGFAKTLQ
ncbi:hypothetical protein H0194_05615 [Corynebacterium incognita]|uniref:Activator of Hsp90 ATPase homolog 1-like protein n=1 Tax=Corynebacterium incognita TaxID=2754725 RepID=A0A7G7CLY4_9CORY|nr:hypothetical protein [Corynebacterium incognita]QNE88600.1 hypothetical protein H0194_05615 [Corynebacterium incognita]